MRVFFSGLLVILGFGGCVQSFDGGIGGLLDWTANMMTVLSQTERTAEFTHPDGPYWIAFVPPKTRVEQIAEETKIPFAAEEVLRLCLADRLPHTVVADRDGIECFQHSRVQIQKLLMRTKPQGQSTRITVGLERNHFIISRVE